MKRIFLIIVVCLTASLCSADMVYLNNGQVFRGEIIAESNESITIELHNGGREVIGMQYVRNIVREEDSRSYRPRMWARYVAEDQWTGDGWVFKLGADLNGKHETSSSNLFIAGSGNSSIDGTLDVGPGMSLDTEYVSYVSDNLGLGGGLTIQTNRGLTGVPGNFSFMPIYGLAKLRTSPGRKGLYEYLLGQLGYNFFSGDMDYTGKGGTLGGGLYFGLGAGVSINRIQIELLYTEDRGSFSDSGYVYDDASGKFNYFNESGNIKYSKLGINVGFLF